MCQCMLSPSISIGVKSVKITQIVNPQSKFYDYKKVEEYFIDFYFHIIFPYLKH